jgi:hypothetical protein
LVHLIKITLFQVMKGQSIEKQCNFLSSANTNGCLPSKKLPFKA